MKTEYQNEPLILVLGFFDGVHLCHKALMKKALELAETTGYKTGVMTFTEHPLELIFPKYSPWLITSNDEKKKLIENYGIDFVFLNGFSEKLMKLSPEDFIVDYLLKRYNIKGIVVGYNYNFGYKGAGNTDVLEELGLKHGFFVRIVKPCIVGKQLVSSTFIRELISCGQIEEVATFLGRYYGLSGKVVRGKGLGRTFGFPTANIKLDKRRILPNTGVYYTRVCHQNACYHGLTNLGFNPTFDKHPFSIETYIYDFNSEIYGDTLSIEFLKKVRGEIKFENLEALIKQVNYDIAWIKNNYINEKTMNQVIANGEKDISHLL